VVHCTRLNLTSWKILITKDMQARVESSKQKYVSLLERSIQGREGFQACTTPSEQRVPPGTIDSDRPDERLFTNVDIITGYAVVYILLVGSKKQDEQGSLLPCHFRHILTDKRVGILGAFC